MSKIQNTNYMKCISNTYFNYLYFKYFTTLHNYNNCSNCSTSTIFGSELDMTISYQFLEGAKLGSLYVGHFG